MSRVRTSSPANPSSGPWEYETGSSWLRRRLSVAEHGVDVLRRKQQLLRTERERRARELASATPAWESACQEAQRWMRRALETAGRQQLPEIAADAELAAVSVTWMSVMNLRVPASATVSVPASLLLRSASLGGSSAFDRAAEHAGSAVRAAVALAAARMAVEAIDAELTATTRQIRLLQRRRLPELKNALGEASRRLDEAERDDGIRARWAAGGSTPLNSDHPPSLSRA